MESWYLLSGKIANFRKHSFERKLQDKISGQWLGVWKNRQSSKKLRKRFIIRQSLFILPSLQLIYLLSTDRWVNRTYSLTWVSYNGSTLMVPSNFGGRICYYNPPLSKCVLARWSDRQFVIVVQDSNSGPFGRTDYEFRYFKYAELEWKIWWRKN